MRATAILVAGIVGVSSLLVALVLAFVFGVGLSQAAGQVWPAVLAAALLAGFVVELDRRVSW